MRTYIQIWNHFFANQRPALSKLQPQHLHCRPRAQFYKLGGYMVKNQLISVSCAQNQYWSLYSLFFLAFLGRFNTLNIQSGNPAWCPAALQALGDPKAAKKYVQFCPNKKKKKKKKKKLLTKQTYKKIAIIRKKKVKINMK